MPDSGRRYGVDTGGRVVRPWDVPLPSRWRGWADDVAAVVASDPTLRHTADLLVVHRGETVAHHRFLPPERRDVFSITKSVLAMVVGLAVEQGRVALDDVVHARDGATVHDHLTMRRGVDSTLADVDAVEALPSGWGRAIAARPARCRPGLRFSYDNEAAHELSTWLTARLGAPVDEVAAELLFRPLGTTDWHWPRDPEGHSTGFAHLHLHAADLARLGELVRLEGVHDGVRVLSASWCRAMVTPTSAGGMPEGVPYGLLTWVDRHGFFFGGWAGQHVSVFPDDELTVVTTGDPGRLAPGWRAARELVVHAHDTATR